MENDPVDVEQEKLQYVYGKWQEVRARTLYPLFCKHPEICCNTGRCQGNPVCND